MIRPSVVLGRYLHNMYFIQLRECDVKTNIYYKIKGRKRDLKFFFLDFDSIAKIFFYKILDTK